MDTAMGLLREGYDETIWRLSQCSPTPYLAFAVGGFASLVALQIQPSQRLATVPLIVAPLYYSLVTAPTATWDMGWSSDWALFIVIFFTHTTHLLYAERHLVPPSKDGGWNFRGAYKVWMDGRGLNLNAKRMAGVRAGARVSRPVFALRRLAAVGVLTAVLHLAPAYVFPGPFLPIDMDDYLPSKTVFVRRALFATPDPLTQHDVNLRAVFAVAWMLVPAAQLMFLHNILSLFFVCVARLDEPEDWPPFFGAVTSIRSLRSFWARFWHRVVVRPYAGYAGMVSRAIGLKPRGNADRFVVHLLVFTLSGGVHAVAGWACGQRCEIWRDYAWYAAQQPAILLEDQVLDGVEWLVGRAADAVGLTKGAARVRAVEAARLVAGLAYLAAWFFWSVPKWYYPKALCEPY